MRIKQEILISCEEEQRQNEKDTKGRMSEIDEKYAKKNSSSD